MPLYLGIDCGGSTTRALVRDSDGHVIFQGRSGAANLASTPPEQVQEHLARALNGAPAVDAAVGCFAGLLTEDDKRRGLEVLKKVAHSALWDAVPDFHATLASFNRETLSVVVAGTGAIVVSQTPDGIIKSWGGGPILGDEGSAFSVGRRALALAILPSDQTVISEDFWHAVENEFGSRRPDEILASLYRRPSQAAQLARLAPIIASDASKGLPYAVESLTVPLTLLGNEVVAHLSRHHPKAPDWTVGLAGGLWETHPTVRVIFESVLAKNEKPVRTVDREVPGEAGAVRLAERLAAKAAVAL